MPYSHKAKQVFHLNLIKEWIAGPGTASDQLWAQAVEEEEEEELTEQQLLDGNHLAGHQQDKLLYIIPDCLFRE